jgi:ribosomal protein L24E
MKKLLAKLLLVGVLFGQYWTLYGQTDTLTFKVKGLVCSFCAHGLNKGIGKLSFTDEQSVFVDIKNQIVKVALNENYKVVPHLKQTTELIRETGYEVDKVFLNGVELK